MKITGYKYNLQKKVDPLDMKNNRYFSGFRNFVGANAPSILTAGSLIGLGLTIYFAVKASKDAAKTQEKAEEELKKLNEQFVSDDISEKEYKQEKRQIQINETVKLVYIYRWSLISGTAAGCCSLLSNHFNGRTIAAMGTMLALNQDKLKKGSEKVKELIGEEKFAQLRENVDRDILGDKLQDPETKIEVSKKTVSAGPPNIDDTEYEQFYDTYFGQIYEIPRGTIDDAIVEAERITFLKWNDWRGILGLEPCDMGYRIGWGPKKQFKAHTGLIDIGSEKMRTIVYDVEPVSLGK